MGPRLISALFLLAFAGLNSGSTIASSFYEAPFPETVRETPNITRGRVGKSETQWVTLGDGSKRLFTFYDVEVTEAFKGKAKGTVRMRELGGEKDGVTLQIPGAAQFSVGEDVVVMLGESVEGSENTYTLAGMSLGKYSIEKGADGKEYLRGSGLGSSKHPAVRNQKETQVTLEGLREIIRAQAAEPVAVKTAEPNVAGGGDQLLSSKAKIRHSDHSSEEEDLSPQKKKTDVPVRPIYVLIGLAVGIFWFLRSRRKRR